MESRESFRTIVIDYVKGDAIRRYVGITTGSAVEVEFKLVDDYRKGIVCPAGDANITMIPAENIVEMVVFEGFPPDRNNDDRLPHPYHTAAAMRREITK